MLFAQQQRTASQIVNEELSRNVRARHSYSGFPVAGRAVRSKAVYCRDVGNVLGESSLALLLRLSDTMVSMTIRAITRKVSVDLTKASKNPLRRSQREKSPRLQDTISAAFRQ